MKTSATYLEHSQAAAAVLVTVNGESSYVTLDLITSEFAVHSLAGSILESEDRTVEIGTDYSPEAFEIAAIRAVLSL